MSRQRKSRSRKKSQVKLEDILAGCRDSTIGWKANTHLHRIIRRSLLFSCARHDLQPVQKHRGEPGHSDTHTRDEHTVACYLNIYAPEALWE